MQPAEPGIETEQETQHWRILSGQLATNCFPSDERARCHQAYGFQSISGIGKATSLLGNAGPRARVWPMRSKNFPVPQWLEERSKIDVPFEKV
jgi:hypothetical protein